MKQLDYIIVGFGIAGATLAAQARKRNKSFVLYDAPLPAATKAAGGTLNPVALRRINAVWKVHDFYQYGRAFYETLQQELSGSFLDIVPIMRLFHDMEEQNNWMVASDRKDLQSYMDPAIHHLPKDRIENPFGCGKVVNSMRLDTVALLQAFRNQLQHENQLRSETFDCDRLELFPDYVHYGDIQASKIIFAEGVHATKNPHFPSDLIIPKKGEYIIIEAPELQLDFVLKGRYFIIPLDNHRYKVGATYAHGDYGLDQTDHGREELETALRKMIKVPFTTVDQIVGMRPTVKDRRPLMGQMDPNSPIYFLNGLGTRGLMMAPYLSQRLIESIEDSKPLDAEMEISRFL